jgi:ribosomal protein L11 methyltransferase
LIRLALRCRRAEAEAVLAELLTLAPSGVEQVDEPAGKEGIVEYAIYGAAGELPELGELQAAAGGALVEIRSEEVPSDWEERWKRFYHPLLIGGQLYVRPPWERPAERGSVTEVVIDPGRAFGTGTHATTSMCLELLLDARPLTGLLFARRRSFCDLGCGSGVLAIAARKLGFRPVLAVDSEIDALEEADRNARLNYTRIETRLVDVRDGVPPVADVVTANLTPGLLRAVAVGWSKAGKRPGTLIASGFLASELDDVSGALAASGLMTSRALVKGDWGALVAG